VVQASQKRTQGLSVAVQARATGSSALLEDHTGARSGDRMDRPKSNQVDRVKDRWSHLLHYTRGSEEEAFPGSIVAVPVSKGHQGIIRQRKRKKKKVLFRLFYPNLPVAFQYV
jgi:hypothetical protein